MPDNDNKTDYTLIIEGGRKNHNYWKDLWHYRELFFFLSWRDILVRYKQTVIGIAWSVIRPLLTMIIFTIVFEKLAKLPSNGVPYPIMVYCALLPWQFFSNAVTESSNSLISNSNLLSKVYFPRLIIPVSSIIVGLIDFFISFLILCLLMIVYLFMPTWKIFTLPLFLIIPVIASLGCGFWFSALTVNYRDFRYVVPFIIQLGLYISPVGFSSAIVPENWKLLYSLNPMAGVIDGFRWAILGDKTEIYLPGFILSVLFSILLFITGLWYFRKMEKSFTDVI